jgi:pimeloyl-ACP methyl ester carboxylesterase
MRLPHPVPDEFAALKQREVDVDGVRIAYTEAGSGPTVVLLHGAVFAGNVFWWETQAALAPYCRTVAPDYPGWGSSDKPGWSYAMEDYHRFVHGFMDALGLERAVIIGHSMGGLVGSSFALLHPERVLAMAAVAAPPAWATTDLPWLFQPFQYYFLGELMMYFTPMLGPRHPLGVRRFYESLFHDVRAIRPDRLHQALEGCCEATADPAHRLAFLNTVRSNRAHFEGGNSVLKDLARDLRVPVTLIAGKQDTLFPLPMIERSATEAPGVRLHVLDRCGHFPTWEQPEQVAALLREVIGEAHSHAGSRAL